MKHKKDIKSINEAYKKVFSEEAQAKLWASPKVVRVGDVLKLTNLTQTSDFDMVPGTVVKVMSFRGDVKDGSFIRVKVVSSPEDESLVGEECEIIVALSTPPIGWPLKR